MTNLTNIKRCAVIGNAVIGVSAFTKSGISLWQLATASGYPAALGWVLPLVLDGMVILATLMLVVDASHRWFAWALLILGSIASTAGNIVHVSMADYSSTFTVAALAAVRLRPELRDWLLFAHHSWEPGHTTLLKALDAEPVLNLSMRLGEGSGAAVAVPVIRSACALHNNMATFADAGVASSQ